MILRKCIHAVPSLFCCTIRINVGCAHEFTAKDLKWTDDKIVLKQWTHARIMHISLNGGGKAYLKSFSVS